MPLRADNELETPVTSRLLAQPQFGSGAVAIAGIVSGGTVRDEKLCVVLQQRNHICK